MSAKTKKPISKSEKQRRAEQSLATVERLLYSRRQTAHALGNVSIATIQRMEARGLLDKIRLAGTPNGEVFHNAEQVRALARRGDHAA